MAYGASLESWLGASPRGFESPILRENFNICDLDLMVYRGVEKIMATVLAGDAGG